MPYVPPRCYLSRHLFVTFGEMNLRLFISVEHFQQRSYLFMHRSSNMSLKVFVTCAFLTVGLCQAGGGPPIPFQQTLVCTSDNPIHIIRGAPGPPGPNGPPGAKGDPGSCVNDCPKIETYTSCEDIKKRMKNAKNGIYTITDAEGSKYKTYCDMDIAGGGWTLVASVHENNLAGKCTVGDRWSSEQGNTAAHPHGDGAWENTKTFGRAESAASDDYKNPGYFNMKAQNVMIWHVPNNAVIKEYSSKAFLKYHTTNGFLNKYGYNLFKLYRDFFPLRDYKYFKSTGNGPAPPVVWDLGDNPTMVANTAPHMRGQTTPGFIQFRAINTERGAFALCPGLKAKTTGPARTGDVEHGCIGGTSFHRESAKHCGDFASKDWNGYGTATGWSSNRQMTESVVMIFYR